MHATVSTTLLYMYGMTTTIFSAMPAMSPMAAKMTAPTTSTHYTLSLEEQMSSLPELLVSLIPDCSHERTSIENASARVAASLVHAPCTDILLPVALDGDPQWTTGTEPRIHAYPGNTKLYRAAQALVHGRSTLVRPTT